VHIQTANKNNTYIDKNNAGFFASLFTPRHTLPPTKTRISANPKTSIGEDWECICPPVARPLHWLQVVRERRAQCLKAVIVDTRKRCTDTA